MNRRTMLVLVLLALLGVGVAGGCGSLLEAGEPGDSPDITPDLPSDEVEIILYFSDWQAQHVIPERRSVTVTDEGDLPGEIVRQLLKGPADPHLNPTLPENVEVLSVEVEGDIVYVNFTKEVEGIAGSAGQTMAVQSLVFALSELEGIERVQLLVEGRKSLEFAGHGVIEEPLTREWILTYPVFLDEERAEWLQERADAGIETFRMDPFEVAAFDGRMAGFTSDDAFVLEDLDADAGTALVTVERDGEHYTIELVQPVRTGDGGIWMIESIHLR